MKGRVTGIGGIFFAAKNPASLTKWYANHLGVAPVFFWKQADDPTKKAYTRWAVLPATDPIFKGTDKDYVYSYRVENLSALMAQLEASGIKSIAPAVSDETGKSEFILDPDNNKIILWEPSDFLPNIANTETEKVTGIGGVFFKTPDPAKSRAWYGEHLGFDVSDWGGTFDFVEIDAPSPDTVSQTAWNPFAAKSDYFNPSTKNFMLNYRVKDLIALLASLTASGITSVAPIQEADYGKFGWILDEEGNKIELWQA